MNQNKQTNIEKVYAYAIARIFLATLNAPIVIAVTPQDAKIHHTSLNEMPRDTPLS